MDATIKFAGVDVGLVGNLEFGNMASTSQVIGKLPLCMSLERKASLLIPDIILILFPISNLSPPHLRRSSLLRVISLPLRVHVRLCSLLALCSNNLESEVVGLVMQCHCWDLSRLRYQILYWQSEFEQLVSRNVSH